MDMPAIDLERAAEIYLESVEAQHGEQEIADFEAKLWFRIFQQVADEMDGGIVGNINVTGRI